MIESHLRSHFQPVFNSIALAIIQLNPNTITILAFLSGVVSALLVISNHLYLALCMLLVSGLFDVLDGTVARLKNQSHPLGAYIDLISDRMVEAAFIFGLAIRFPQNALAYILFLIALLLHFATFLAAGALFKNDGPKSMHYDHSYIQRAEAFIVFCALLLFPTYIYPVLTLFASLIFLDGSLRFKRVVQSFQ